MMRAQNEADYLAEVCRIVVEDCGHAMVWVGYAEQDEAKSVRPVASAGFEVGYLETLNITWADTPRGRGPTGTAIRTGKPSASGNFLTDPKFEPWREEALRRGYASSAVFPLTTDGKTFGAITIYSTKHDAFNDEEMDLLSKLADDLAYGITAIRLQAEVVAARAEAQRRVAELESFMSNMADGVWLLDTDCRVVWMNNGARGILRVPPEETFWDWTSRCKMLTLDDVIIAPEEAAGWHALRGERISDLRHKFVTPSGETLVLSISASPVLDGQGRVIGATVSFRDQSERVAFENDKQRLLDRERRIAQMLQEALIPVQIPKSVAGCHFAAKYVPALDEAHVGGDFYDVFDLGDGRVAVVIGDVAGKGVAAAMQVSAARYAFRSYAYIEPSPSRVVTLVNDALCKDADGGVKMLTAFFGVIEPGKRTATYAIAGHEPPVVRRRDGSVQELNLGGLALGVFPGYGYQEGSIGLDPGDVLVMVTDGITEARSAEQGMLGKSGLLDFLVAEKGSPSELVDRLLEKAREYCNGRLLDDVAIVALGYGP
jgi:serine phosphatase RsbU (regulator of sigma subunit)/PAS domain-containing protein